MRASGACSGDRSSSGNVSKGQRGSELGGCYLRKSGSAVRAAAPVGAVDGTIDSGSARGTVAPALVSVEHVAGDAAGTRDGVHASRVVSGVGAVRGVEGRGAEVAVKGALGLSGEGEAAVEARSAAVWLAGGAGRAVGARVVVEVAHVVGLLSHGTRWPGELRGQLLAGQGGFAGASGEAAAKMQAKRGCGANEAAGRGKWVDGVLSVQEALHENSSRSKSS